MKDEIKLGLSLFDRLFLIILPPVLGGVVGWFAPVIASWIAKLPFIPYVELIKWIAELNTPWVTWITLIIGIVAGIFFTMHAFAETMALVIHDTEVKITLGDKEETFEKNKIEALFMDGKQLVLLGDHGKELYRGKPDMKVDIIREAFEKYDYPWREQDPYQDAYVRWVDQHPEFQTHINALLAAREVALEKKEDKKASDLRKDLAAIDIVIHDEDEKQYVRMAKG